jgi:hypothetical protein
MIRPSSLLAATARWFAEQVVGGEQSFLISAFGCEDFGRAIQQKRVSEIRACGRRSSPPRSRIRPPFDDVFHLNRLS